MNNHDLSHSASDQREGPDLAGKITWHTDGQGNSWGHFPEEEKLWLPWWVLFAFGCFVGVVFGMALMSIL